MGKEFVYMGSLVRPWMSNKNIKYITFSVTDDCNLMCEYCYFTHKNNKNKMSFEVAKEAVDYILSEKSFSIYDGVVWDFIGGEPTLEMDLIDNICDYILYKMYTENHPWLNCYRFMIGTNGLLYDSEKFQRFLSKHKYNLHVAITVDGSKEKHDLSRIKKDGTGSYDDVVRVLPLWFKQIGSISTKATFSHLDLPYLKDSIINLWDLGFKNVMANVVFENVWHKNDDVVFEQQLCMLADYVIDNCLWNDVSVRFFAPTIGYPIGDQEKKLNYCGTGNMLAIDYKGNFYPCIRFMDSALNNKRGRIIGNSQKGIETDKVRAFNMLSYDAQSPAECISCDISKGCSWCTGLNYDEADSDTIFERQTFICKMHRANVRANKYFWRKYEKASNKVSPLRYNMYTDLSSNSKYLYILHNNKFSYCSIDSDSNAYTQIDNKTYNEAIDFCYKNNFIPVHVGFKESRSFGYYIGDCNSQYDRNEMTIDVLDHFNMEKISSNLSTTIIYRIKHNFLNSLYQDVKEIFNNSCVKKINITAVDYNNWSFDDLKTYKRLLLDLSKYVFEMWKVGKYIQIDVITDNILMEKKSFCNAGTKSFAIAPDGKVYNCLAYYLKGLDSIGTLSDLSNICTSNKDLLVCDYCEVKKCNKCMYFNQLQTGESIVPFEVHCVKANLELNAGVFLLKLINDNDIELPFELDRRTRESACIDPLISFRGDKFSNQHLYEIGDIVGDKNEKNFGICD